MLFDDASSSVPAATKLRASEHNGHHSSLEVVPPVITGSQSCIHTSTDQGTRRTGSVCDAVQIMLKAACVEPLAQNPACYSSRSPAAREYAGIHVSDTRKLSQKSSFMDSTDPESPYLHVYGSRIDLLRHRKIGHLLISLAHLSVVIGLPANIPQKYLRPALVGYDQDSRTESQYVTLSYARGLCTYTNKADLGPLLEQCCL